MIELDFEDLINAHRAYYRTESRASYYDAYMKCKDWDKWTSTVPACEVMKLFGFVLSWDPHFKGNLRIFTDIYEESSFY